MVKWLEAIQWTLVAAMFAVGALVWPIAPDQMVVHWNLAGRPDRYGGKLEGLLLIPAVTLLIALGLRFLPMIDPHRARYAEFAGAYAVVRLAIIGLMAGIYCALVLSALGTQINMGLVVGVLVGLLLMVSGAVMDRLRPNWFVGIRTPWTLSSDDAWRATHRAGKWVFIVIGLACVLAGVMQSAGAVIGAIVLAILGVVGLVVYSYVAWRRSTR